jgi:hypothetical protein
MIIVAVLAAAVPVGAASAVAAEGDQAQPMQPSAPDAMHHHATMSEPAAQRMPTLPGQDAFGAIQEIVAILEADPHTDWSKVDLEGLRQHLIDMNEVTLHAEAKARRIPGGLDITVTGHGRALAAIHRMVAAQAQMIEGHDGWSASAAALPGGERLIVTAKDPKETAHIRGLGFIGLMASGMHHQAHHLAMARGTFGHAE